MKRIISILIMCAMLTGCGNSYEYENSELPTVSPTEITSETADKTDSAEEKSENIGEISCEVTTTCSDMTSPTSQPAEIAAGSPDEPIAAEIQETEAVSDNTKEEKEPVISEESAEIGTTAQHPTTPCTTEKAVTTTTYAAPEKPKSVQTTVPPITTIIVTTPVTEPITEPPAQPETKPEIILENDGTDYGKARAVYEYMCENGSGTCVNYACRTYEMCQEVGLPCYIVWTEDQLCGHVANTVRIGDIWYILDAQGGYFLEYNYGFTEVVDIDGNHIADGDMLSNFSYDELN